METHARHLGCKCNLLHLTVNASANRLSPRPLFLPSYQLLIQGMKHFCVQVELMVAKNQALLTEKAEMKMKAQLADQTEQELAKKSQVFQKTIKNLVIPYPLVW